MSNATFTICHPRTNGAGSALRFTLFPATGGAEGWANIKIAPQENAPSSLINVPRFGWDDATEIYLSPVEVGEVLMVLRGMQESIADGNGLFIRTPECSTVFRFCHRGEPVPGFAVSIDKTFNDGELVKAQIVLRPVEAIVLEAALSGGMKDLVFG